jgi:single-strand DNA-binding protein
MAGYNRVIIIGNLTRDPDYKQLSSGQAVCRLSIASNRQFKNRQSGSMVQEVCYIDVDVWGPQAESCKQYLQKGRPVLVEGRLKLDSWEDTNGQNRSKHSIVADKIVFLGTAGTQDDVANMRTESDESGMPDMSGPRLDPNNEKEREILAHIEQLKNKKTTAPAKKNSIKKEQSEPGMSANSDVSAGEINFKDEQPFREELPF